MVRLLFWRVWSTTSLVSLPDALWLGLIVPIRAPSMSRIDLFKNYLNSKGPCAKDSLKTTAQKMQIRTYNERDSLTSWYKITLDRLTYWNQPINWSLIFHILLKQLNPFFVFWVLLTMFSSTHSLYNQI